MNSTGPIQALLEELDPVSLKALFGRSMLLTQEWALHELQTLAQVAKVFEGLDREGIRAPLFPEELCYALFCDSSTRTRSSWAGAAARLGARPVVVDGASTQVSHGET